MKFLIVEARYYDALADALLGGARAVLDEAGAEYDILTVPGALEIPPAIAIAIESGGYDGVIALGCVIRGKTKHFDIVAEQSARGLMDLGINHRLAIGTGILTVENESQAWERADPKRLNKGGEAARAALSLAHLAKQYSNDRV